MKIFLLLLSYATICAQGPGEFRIAPVKDTTRYHMGETISLRVSFGTAAYVEGFHVTPRDGIAEPLRAFMDSQLYSTGKGNFWSQSGDSSDLLLNERVRFDLPGNYHLSITARVVDEKVSPEAAARILTSNEIEFEILPSDPAWEAAELRRLIKLLGPPPRGPVFDTPPSVRAISYLGTPDAQIWMAHCQAWQDECGKGLIGARDPSAGSAELARMIRDPSVPVNEWMVNTFSGLGLHAGDPPETLSRQREANLQRALDMLGSGLSLKRGKALAISADTLLSHLPPDTPEAIRRPLTDKLVESFLLLPGNSQQQWLEYRWQDVKGPQWLPVLRKLASDYEYFPVANRNEAPERLGIGAAALRHWFELDPDGARSAIVEEMRRPKPRFDASVLGMLGEKSIPDIEPVLAQHLMETDGGAMEPNLLSLMERYGDGSMLPQVLRRGKEAIGEGPCDQQNALLSYVLKFDAQFAKPLLEGALAARGKGKNGCRRTMLTVLGVKHGGPTLDEIAIRALDDSDADVAMDAADYLGRYGAAGVEVQLWRHFEAWCKTAKPDGTPDNFYSALHPGDHLAAAIVEGNAWLTDEFAMRRMLPLAPEGQVRRRLGQWLAKWIESRTSIEAQFGPPDQPQIFRLASYRRLSLEQLKRKVAQYPHGTEFVFSADTAPGSSKDWFPDVAKAVTESGQTLHRAN